MACGEAINPVLPLENADGSRTLCMLNLLLVRCFISRLCRPPWWPYEAQLSPAPSLPDSFGRGKYTTSHQPSSFLLHSFPWKRRALLGGLPLPSCSPHFYHFLFSFYSTVLILSVHGLSLRFQEAGALQRRSFDPPSSQPLLSLAENILILNRFGHTSVWLSDEEYSAGLILNKLGTDRGCERTPLPQRLKMSQRTLSPQQP